MVHVASSSRNNKKVADTNEEGRIKSLKFKAETLA
jgi:hypothetical protein